MQSGKEEIQTIFILRHYMKNSEEFSHKLPELIDEFNKIAGHQVNT